ncbi:MAG: acetoacetate decarboxylase family protein [Dehalococcoidia bacterium]|nr:acetoacetate decarboxylase family protein [Dehalococcoidia bacterium]
MPLTGTRDLATLVRHAPAVPKLEVDRWELPRAQVLQLMFEIHDSAMTSLIPRALHPTIPPTLVMVATRVPESPVGPFVLAEVRVGCRSGARPRAFLARGYCDSAAAIEALGERWGYPLQQAAVTLEKRYDRIRATVDADGRSVLDMSLVNPEPISGNDLQYLPNLNLARVIRDGVESPRLVQVDPDFVFHSSDRGKPQLDAFEADAWELPGAVVNHPVSASFAVTDITMPALRYLVDPAKGPLEAVEKVATG